MRLRQILYDVINGVRSGIPICCVIWFAKNCRLHSRAHQWQLPDREVGYVRCPRCIQKDRAVQVRKNGVILRRLIMPKHLVEMFEQEESKNA